MLFRNLERIDLRNHSHYLGVSSPILEFSFRITKGSWDTQPAREYPYGPNYKVLFFISIFLIGTTVCCCSLVHLSTSGYDSFVFILVRRFMVLTKSENLLPSVHRHNCSWVSNIYHITNISNNKYTNCTRTWSFNNL